MKLSRSVRLRKFNRQRRRAAEFAEYSKAVIQARAERKELDDKEGRFRDGAFGTEKEMRGYWRWVKRRANEIYGDKAPRGYKLGVGGLSSSGLKTGKLTTGKLRTWNLNP